MNIKRIASHLLMTSGRVNRAFPRSVLDEVEQMVAASEAQHTGEIRFIVEGGLDGSPLFQGQSARERAIDLFSHLRIWDTEDNSGLLIYLLLADRAVEIVADRGIAAKVNSNEWTKICRQMEMAFRQSDFDFHEVIWIGSGNGFLKRIGESLNVLGLEFRKRASEKPDVLEQSLRDHRLLLDALTARDPEAAARAAEAHMQNVYQSTISQGE